MKLALIALVIVNVFDIVIHVATDQVEPLRITGNVIILISSLVLLTVPGSRRAWVPLLAGALSLALNLVFVANEGLGRAGWILVGTTTLLSIVVGVQLARRDRHSPRAA